MLPDFPGFIFFNCAGSIPFIIWLRFAIGEEVRSRNLLPVAESHSEISPVDPRVASTRPSELKPASLGAFASLSVCSSRPDFTSQIFTWFSLLPNWPRVRGFLICASLAM